jgi:DNA-binding transcriptional regulator YiaG
MWTPAAVKKLRKALNLTQEGMARRVGVTTITINRWEKGHVKPTGLSLVMLDEVKKSLNGDNEGKSK